MDITVAQVRDALRKDDFSYINTQIERGIATAKAALYTAIGYDDTQSPSSKTLPEANANKFESLSNQYIVEFVRGTLDSVDNERTLTILATQCEALLIKAEA